MRGATTYTNKRLGVEIRVSAPAEELLGAGNVPEFVRLLTDLMSAVHADWAFVSKLGGCVHIWIYREDGWRKGVRLEL